MATNRLMRVSPSGPFAKDPVSGAGPLEVGDGTPGRVFRAEGIRNDGNVGLGGAASVSVWQDPALPLGTGPGLTLLPFVLGGDYLWDLDLYLPIEANMLSVTLEVRLFGRNLDTLVRTLLAEAITQTPADAGAGVSAAILFPVRSRIPRLAMPGGVDHDQIELELDSPTNGAANELITDQLSMRITQYAQGSL